ncbi:MAG TPA: hypothetical protein VGN97_15095 [Mesorhizobium sp.]|jgi:hypothetical protein|nr:hypothetical protein [Mesorhizobium sp.]
MIARKVVLLVCGSLLHAAGADAQEPAAPISPAPPPIAVPNTCLPGCFTPPSDCDYVCVLESVDLQPGGSGGLFNVPDAGITAVVPGWEDGLELGVQRPQFELRQMNK